MAKDVETAIVNEARTFSDSEYLYIGKCDVKDYGTSYFVDVRLNNDSVDFELWKGLWDTHWKSGEMVIPHVMWFDNIVNSVENNVTTKI